jgi:hypothetical protein
VSDPGWLHATAVGVSRNKAIIRTADADPSLQLEASIRLTRVLGTLPTGAKDQIAGADMSAPASQMSASQSELSSALPLDA